MSYKKQSTYKFSMLSNKGKKIIDDVSSNSDASSYYELPGFLADTSGGEQKKKGPPIKGYRYLYFTVLMFLLLSVATVYQGTHANAE